MLQERKFAEMVAYCDDRVLRVSSSQSGTVWTVNAVYCKPKYVSCVHAYIYYYLFSNNDLNVKDLRGYIYNIDSINNYSIPSIIYIIICHVYKDVLTSVSKPAYI